MQSMERKQGIVRWEMDDSMFIGTRDQFRLEEIVPTIQSLFKAFSDRKYCLELMRGRDNGESIKTCHSC